MARSDPRKHGHTKYPGQCSPTYNSWRSMKARCTNSKRHNSAQYLGKGIVVCDRWLEFVNFLEDMGERPEGMSLDRIDNNDNYHINNCRWATQQQQSDNRRF